VTKRKYVSVDDIQREYLPISKKRIRAFVRIYLPMKLIGSRIFTDREALEQLLADPDRILFPLD